MSYKQLIANMYRSETELYIDGQSLQTLVPGYRTEKVEGRSTISVNIRESSSSTMNGAAYRDKRLKTRTITVSYGLVADTLTELRESEDRLRYYLSGENMKVSFEDELNKYYICNMSDMKPKEVDASGSAFYFEEGTITLHRTDPYKYSTTTTKISPDENFVFQFYNNGTQESYPIIKISVSGIGSLSCAKISNKDEHTITVGETGIEIKPFTEGESSFDGSSMYDTLLDGGYPSTADSEYTLDADGGYSFSTDSIYTTDYNGGYPAPEWNVTLDVANADISVEGKSRSDLGDIRNEWEEFTIHPGGNYMKFELIEGLKIVGVTITYREVYL